MSVVKAEKQEVEKEVNETEEVVEQKKPDIFDLLAEKPGAPSKETVDRWKAQTGGDVYATVLGRGDVFIFRSIKRLEWKNLEAQIKQAKQPDENALAEAVVKTCVLYPDLRSPEGFAMVKAGTVPTLFDQICFYSNFMDPAISITMVYEL